MATPPKLTSTTSLRASASARCEVSTAGAAMNAAPPLSRLRREIAKDFLSRDFLWSVMEGSHLVDGVACNERGSVVRDEGSGAGVPADRHRLAGGWRRAVLPCRDHHGHSAEFQSVDHKPELRAKIIPFGDHALEDVVGQRVTI